MNIHEIFGYATHHIPALCYGAATGLILSFLIIIPSCIAAFNAGFKTGYDNGWERYMTGWAKGKGWKRTLEERRKRK